MCRSSSELLRMTAIAHVSVRCVVRVHSCRLMLHSLLSACVLSCAAPVCAQTAVPNTAPAPTVGTAPYTSPASTTRPGSASTARSVVLWERELTPEDKLRYTDGGAVFSLPADTNIEEIKKGYTVKPPQGDTYKVEAIIDPRNPSEILLKFHNLGAVIAVAERANKWRTEIGKTFAIGYTFKDYNYQGASCGAGESETLFPGSGAFVGHALEYYRDKVWGAIDDEMFDVPDRAIDTHEFARLFIHVGQFKLVKTDYGNMVEVVQANRNAPAKQLIWLSGEHHAICLRAIGDKVYDFLPIYAKAFPSSLPADFKVDRLAWANAELDLQLSQLKIHLGDPVSPQGNHFEFHMSLLQNTIYSPLWDDRYAWRPQSPSDQPKRYKALLDWWSANKNQVVWDEAMQMLVVPGQRPVDVAAAKIKEAKEKQKLRMNAPFTSDDEAAAEKAFASIWDEEFKRTVTQISLLVEKDKLAEIHSGQTTAGDWFVEFPLMGKVERREYSRPKFVPQTDPQFPLRAEIALGRTSSEPDHSGRMMAFVYDKIEKKWSRSD